MLSDREREVWSLRLSGLEQQEIADALGCTIFVVRTALRSGANRVARGAPAKDRNRDKFRDLGKLGRCHCGMLLPCYHEDPIELASRRRFFDTRSLVESDPEIRKTRRATKRLNYVRDMPGTQRRQSEPDATKGR
jgi:hypothetical protein